MSDELNTRTLYVTGIMFFLNFIDKKHTKLELDPDQCELKSVKGKSLFKFLLEIGFVSHNY